MSDKELLKAIQKDIKTIDKCIDMGNDEDAIDYLKSIQKHMRIIENELKENINDKTHK